MLRDQGINWFEDFEPIAQFGLTNQALVVQQSSDIKSATDLIEHIKAEFEAGNKTRWSHPGRGSVSHVGVTAFLAQNNILDMTQDVPFQGGAETRNALISGEVTFSVSGAHTIPAFSEELLGVGLLAEDRDAVVDDIPTLAEQGIPFVPTESPIVLAAPKGVSAEFVECMSDVVAKATEHPSFKNLARKAEQAVVYRGAADTKAHLMELADQWAPTIDYVRERLEN
jgi:tripartite-type tricarboxylate transporter receptor subunit TctC